MRYALAIALSALLAALALVPSAPARAQETVIDRENQCVARCPKPPTFSGFESDTEWRRRMDLEHQYNICRSKCMNEAAGDWAIRIDRFDDGSRSYFRRNTFRE